MSTTLLFAWRSIRRHLGYTALHVVGFSVGLACVLLIGLFVRDELSYDRFHANADRIYRVADSTGTDLSSSAALAPALMADIPGIENTVRFNRDWFDVLVRHEQATRTETGFFFADSTLFDVFTFPLLQGDPKTALVRPYTIVLTQSAAHRHFGTDDVLGQTLSIEGPQSTHDFEVTGIARDVPQNAHFHWSILASFSTQSKNESRSDGQGWWYVGEHTYALLEPGTDIASTEAAISKLVNAKLVNPSRVITRPKTLQPLTDLYLHYPSAQAYGPTSTPLYLWIFGTVALLVLLIVCINYVTLATARASSRMREIGMRKAVGAGRWQLARQLIAESLGTALLALVPAALLTWAGLGLLNQVTGKALSLGDVSLGTVLMALAAFVVVGVLAGLYPALYLSRLQPVDSLSGRADAQSRWVSSGLVAFQFACVVALVGSTFVLNQQMSFVQQQRLGVDSEQVAILRSAGGPDRQGFGAFRDALRSHPAVVEVAIAGDALPMTDTQTLSFVPEGFEGQAERPRMVTLSASRELVSALGLELVEGELLPQADVGFDDRFPVLINETAAREWGWEEPIGKTFSRFAPNTTVVGVVSDFRYLSAREEILPLVLLFPLSTEYTYVRFQADQASDALAAIDTEWAAFGPGTAADVTFLDDRFAALYTADQRLMRMFGAFSLLAVALSCLGLVGIATFTVRQRTREIGIRKALGATAAGVAVLLAGRFAWLVAAGFVIGAPVAWLASNWWLGGFAERVTLSPLVLILAGAIALATALLAIAYPTWTAATRNPADVLRDE
jgi:putative ABC transport system permease protein